MNLRSDRGVVDRESFPLVWRITRWGVCIAESAVDKSGYPELFLGRFALVAADCAHRLCNRQLLKDHKIGAAQRGNLFLSTSDRCSASIDGSSQTIVARSSTFRSSRTLPG